MAPSLVDTALAPIPSKGNGDIAWSDKSAHLVKRVGRDNVNHWPPQKPYTVCIDSVPVTIERLPHIWNEGDRLIDPGTARANIAPTNESPEGTLEDDWAERHKHLTVVQQHCSYWDKDGDGVIWPVDTYNGVRAWGWNIFLSLLATFIINFNLSYPTGPGWLPDPFFRIWIKNVHKDKHGSTNFEDFFSKYDQDNKGGLNIYDLARALKGQRMAFDFFGWSAAFLEWLATYLLLWPEDGVLRKEDVRRVFDGSIFQKKADDYAEKCAREGRTRKAMRYSRTGY
ncbi:Caleosin-domain-containing protein [Teratosphaeria destructans]|uniref:Caleosin-domain-containing protein n=1 Tax=Teratosphaeria destructans TaxID=418781 RepID=A0A9W7SIH0_9PEZI|nr:Caleosin-domain-containing protein [Teratosphaeria destructans]